MQKRCTYCDQPFRSPRSNRKYCSDNCRQMAYYARNGFLQAQGQRVGSVDGGSYIQAPVIVKYNGRPAAKYVKPVQTVNVKQGGEVISEAMLATLAERILSLIEERIDQKLETVKYGLSDTVKHVNVKEPLNVKDRASVKRNFTSNTLAGNPDSTMCRVQPFAGLYSNSVSVKHDSRDIVKDDIDAVKYESTLRYPAPSIKDDTDFTDGGENELEYVQVQELMDDDDNDSYDVETEAEDQDEDMEEEQSEDDTLKREAASCNLRQHFTSPTDRKDIDEDTDIAPADIGKDVIVKNVNKLPVNRKDEYEWIEPAISEEITDFLRKRPGIDTHLDALGMGDERRDCVKALTYSKCLIRNVIRLSDGPAVNAETFVALTNTFTKLVRSNLFTSLPVWFDVYTSTICNLQSKLRSMGMACEGNEPVRIRLSRNMKAQLMAIRFDLDYYVGDISFKEISLPG